MKARFITLFLYVYRLNMCVGVCLVPLFEQLLTILTSAAGVYTTNNKNYIKNNQSRLIYTFVNTSSLSLSTVTMLMPLLYLFD